MKLCQWRFRRVRRQCEQSTQRDGQFDAHGIPSLDIQWMKSRAISSGTDVFTNLLSAFQGRMQFKAQMRHGLSPGPIACDVRASAHGETPAVAVATSSALTMGSHLSPGVYVCS